MIGVRSCYCICGLVSGFSMRVLGIVLGLVSSRVLGEVVFGEDLSGGGEGGIGLGWV